MKAFIAGQPKKPERTPEQVIHDFVTAYSPETVESLLWAAFSGYVSDHAGNPAGVTENQKKVARFFDAINELARAEHALDKVLQTG